VDQTDGLSNVEHQVAQALEDGRCTAPYLADELDYSHQYIHETLAGLVDKGIAKRVHTGLYAINTEK
jgi:predicted HTH transcriptional regulator